MSPDYFPSPVLKGARLPFSEAVKVDETLYVSGQIGNLPGTLTLVPGGIRAETKQALENIQAVLERHGATMEQIVKCSAFLADMGDWPAFNEVYLQFFPRHLPARSALGASGLAVGARIEIECIAHIPAL